jgi:hypothetical protein
MRKILNLSFALFILTVLATPGLAYRNSDRGPSNIAPGTRFGREPLARKPYPYLYPVNRGRGSYGIYKSQDGRAAVG